MAEFDELDDVLRDVLQRAAQPGDSTGVAEAIRSRVAAGDPGISVGSSTAPGWGGGAWSWMPWVGLVVVAGIGGTALGASGVLGAEATTETVIERTAVLNGTAQAASCPGGPIIDTLAGGTRVLVVERSEDVTHLGIRDPHDFSAVLWLRAADVVVDAREPAIDSLPIGDACPVVILTAPLPVETAAPAPEETPVPVPVPGDTTAPAVLQYGATPLFLQSCSGYDTANLSAVASDDVGVTRVEVSWSGSSAGLAPLQPNAGQWVGSLTVPTSSSGPITLVFHAYDAAGNQSPEKAVNVNVSSCPM